MIKYRPRFIGASHDCENGGSILFVTRGKYRVEEIRLNASQRARLMRQLLAHTEQDENGVNTLWKR